jgi:HK97 family phage portal protein
MIANANRILWLPGDDSRNWDYESGGWAGGNRNPSGVKIDAETALRSTVVLACIRVLSTSVAGLPLHLYRRLAGGGKEIAREHPLYRILHTQPNSWQTSFEWREQMMLHLLTTGAAFDEKVYAGGSISEIVPLHPSRMKVEQIENMRLRYTYREASGSSTVYTQDAIMSVRGMSDDGVHGLSMIEMARDAIGLSRACEIHGASFFGNGARPGVILSTDQMLSPEAAENTRNQWERAHRGADRAHKTAVLQGGLKVNELGGNNQEAQFLEARRFQVEEICRLWGVPPHLVGDLSRSSYSNIEQQSLDYVQNGLMPWLRRIESAIARDLLEGDEEYFAEFDTRGSLRADAAGRATYYNTLWQLGVASVNEIRAWENMNPVEGGDTRFVQLNMTTLEKAAAEPEEPVPVVEEIVVEEQPAEPVAAGEPESPQIADVSLNGAQTSGILEILTKMNEGLIDAVAAKALIMAAFPSFPQSNVDAIIAGTSTKPLAEEPAPEPVAEPEAPAAASLPTSRDCGTGSGGFKPGNKCAPGGSGGTSDLSNGPSDGYVSKSSGQAKKDYDAGDRREIVSYVAFRQENKETSAMIERVEEAGGKDAMYRALQSGNDWQGTAWQSAADEWAAAEALGGNGTSSKATKDAVKGGKALSENDIKAFEARKQATIDHLRKEYGDEMTLYRGVKGSQAKKIRESSQDEVDLGVYSLSSFATSRASASGFAGKSGVVVEVKVPVEDAWMHRELMPRRIASYSDDAGEVVIHNKTKTRKARVSR